MKSLIKSISFIVLFSFLSGCATSQKPIENYVKVGRVEQVILKQHEEKASILGIIASAAIGGVVGHQFGGGSGKDWATGIGAVVAGAGANKAFTKKYDAITYQIYFPIDKTRTRIVSKDLNNNVFRNDLLIVTKQNGNYSFTAYGQFTKKRYIGLSQALKSGWIK